MEIKPCPFCGSEKLYTDEGLFKKYVFCRNCHAYGPSGDTVEEALRLWNHAPRMKEEPKMEKMLEIKCCECGNHTLRLIDDAYEAMYRIQCANCGRRTVLYESVDEAIANWNQGYYEKEGNYISINANTNREPENKKVVSYD